MLGLSFFLFSPPLGRGVSQPAPWRHAPRLLASLKRSVCMSALAWHRAAASKCLLARARGAFGHTDQAWLFFGRARTAGRRAGVVLPPGSLCGCRPWPGPCTWDGWAHGVVHCPPACCVRRRRHGMARQRGSREAAHACMQERQSQRQQQQHQGQQHQRQKHGWQQQCRWSCCAIDAHHQAGGLQPARLPSRPPPPPRAPRPRLMMQPGCVQAQTWRLDPSSARTVGMPLRQLLPRQPAAWRAGRRRWRRLGPARA